jgi:hypothetical protein
MVTNLGQQMTCFGINRLGSLTVIQVFATHLILYLINDLFLKILQQCYFLAQHNNITYMLQQSVKCIRLDARVKLEKEKTNHKHKPSLQPILSHYTSLLIPSNTAECNLKFKYCYLEKNCAGTTHTSVFNGTGERLKQVLNVNVPG